MLNGEQAVVLADITLDQLLATTEQISAEDGTSSFLLAADVSVILHENEEYLPKEEGNTLLTDHVKIDLSVQFMIMTDCRLYLCSVFME